MPLPELLRDHLTDHDLAQKSVAMDWLTRWQDAGGQGFAHDTVESRFSQLLHGHAKGVAFFLDDPRRFELLLDALDLPDDARASWRLAADELRRLGPAGSPRLVLDLAGLATARASADRLFDAVERLLADPALRPARLVVDDAAFRWMPRTVDALDRVEIERVADAAAAGARVDALAAPGALVVSANAAAPHARWAVPILDRAELRTEPPDAVVDFLAGRPLPGPPTPAFTLDALLARLPERVVDGFRALKTEANDQLVHVSTPQTPTPSAADRRRLARTLGDPHALHPNLTWGHRLDLGAALGVPVAASEVERAQVAHWIATAALGRRERLSPSTRAQLDDTLRRAARRPTADALHLVGRVLHVVNPSVPLPEDDLLGPFVRAHLVATETPVLQRLVDAVDGWTADDWDLDPGLIGVCGALIDAGHDPRLVIHARAWLLARRPAAPALACADPIGALRRIVSHPPPAARLRVTTFVDHNGRTAPATAWGAPIGALAARVRTIPEPLTDVGLSPAPPLDRDDLGTPTKSGRPFVSPGIAPAAVASWLNDAESDPWVRDGHTSGRGSPARATCDPAVWEVADRHVAVLWHALRHGARWSEAVPMHDGRALLPVGGMYVLVDVRARRNAAAPRVVLPATSRHDHTLALTLALHPQVVSDDGRRTATGPQLPPVFEVSGGADVLTLTPVATPWGAPAAHADGALAAERAAAKRRRDDD